MAKRKKQESVLPLPPDGGAGEQPKDEPEDRAEDQVEEEAEEQAEEEEEEEEVEKLNRYECAHRILAAVDGDTTLSELAEKADALFVAHGGDESDTDTAAWHLQKVLEHLEGLGLVELDWEMTIHPKVARLGNPDGQG